MSASHVLAIDQGTTNTKALLVNRQGQTVASASRGLSIRYPQPAWVEQDARELWTSVREAVDACLEKAGDPPVAAIGIANQRESVVVWDRRTGEPAGPCAVWQCRRTAPFCAELRRRGVEDLLLFSASKARWLLEHIPDGEKRAEKAGIVRDLGPAAAYYIETTLKSNDVVGISSWSAALLAMVDSMHPNPRPGGPRVVQILGGVGTPARRFMPRT